MQLVFHAAAVFILVWLLVRVVGKREVGQFSPFDFVILVVIGDLVAEGVIAEDTSLTGAVIAASTIGIMTVAVSWVSWRFRGTRSALEGVPTLLIRRGQLVDEALRLERLDVADLHEAARKDGIRDLDDVEWAVLEQDGSFTFFERESSS